VLARGDARCHSWLVARGVLRHVTRSVGQVGANIRRAVGRVKRPDRCVALFVCRWRHTDAERTEAARNSGRHRVRPYFFFHNAAKRRARPRSRQDVLALRSPHALRPGRRVLGTCPRRERGEPGATARTTCTARETHSPTRPPGILDTSPPDQEPSRLPPNCANALTLAARASTAEATPDGTSRSAVVMGGHPRGRGGCARGFPPACSPPLRSMASYPAGCTAEGPAMKTPTSAPTTGR
jgi:hypothetical protein